MKKEINSNNAPSAIGPYSQAIRAGNILFISGQIPIDYKTGNISGDTIKIQAHTVLENIKNILISADLSLENVTKTTIFLKDLSLFESVNEIYANYFKNPFPARSTVEVSRLPKDVLIEIEAVAIY